jgi:TPR repeat protein
MRLIWRIAGLFLAASVICGVAITWQANKSKVREEKLAEDANALWRSAELGNPEAQFRVGNMYHEGHGVPLNYTEALRWFHRAADQGSPKAQYALGYMYDLGQGLPRDYSQAFYWYRKAADQGNSRAQCGLGAMYYEGRGVQQDFGEAARWYRRAADQGHPKAQYDLGYMYEFGEGLTKDLVEAKRWYRLAADQRDPQALVAVGGEASPLEATLLILQFAGGIWLALHFVVTKSSNLLRSAEPLRKALVVFAGVLGALSAIFNCYGYLSHRIRSLSYGLDPFNGVRWSLYVVLVVLLLYIVLSGKSAQNANSRSTQ